MQGELRAALQPLVRKHGIDAVRKTTLDLLEQEVRREALASAARRLGIKETPSHEGYMSTGDIMREVA